MNGSHPGGPRSRAREFVFDDTGRLASSPFFSYKRLVRGSLLPTGTSTSTRACEA